MGRFVVDADVVSADYQTTVSEWAGHSPYVGDAIWAMKFRWLRPIGHSPLVGDAIWAMMKSAGYTSGLIWAELSFRSDLGCFQGRSCYYFELRSQRFVSWCQSGGVEMTPNKQHIARANTKGMD